MKKVLLFSLAFFIAVGSSYAQKRTLKKATREIQKHRLIDIERPVKAHNNLYASPDYLKGSNGINDIELIVIGESANIYSVLVEDQHCLSFDQDANTYLFAHRANPDIYPGASNSGTIMSTISLDNGMTWNSTIAIDDAEKLARYPSGAIFNPGNSTDFNDCYGIFMGPVTGGTWTHNFFSNYKLDGSVSNVEYFEMDGNLTFAPYRLGLYATDDGFFHGMGYGYNAGSNWTDFILMFRNGEFNEDTQQFEFIDEVRIDMGDYVGLDGAGELLIWGDTRACWNQDGSIGYTFVNGTVNDLAGETGYQPIVFLTEDQGESWDLIDIDDLVDNDDFPAFAEHLFENWEERIIPKFVGTMDGVVDMNGDLQLFAEVGTGTSTHVDSLTYYYTNDLYPNGFPTNIFNLTINSDGLQDVIWCDSINAQTVPSSSNNAYAPGSDGLGWNNRLQASRSDDGKAVFAIWTDTKDFDQGSNSQGENADPDIYGWGKYISTGEVNGPHAFTYGLEGDLKGRYYFTYTSTTAKKEADQGEHHIYSLGVSTSVTPLEMVINGYLDKVTHSYVDGIEFSFLFTGEEENFIGNNDISVSQNHPNPFNTTSNIEVTLTKKADLSFEVVNLMGQVVFEDNRGNVASGTHVFSIKASDFGVGVYFYNVKSGSKTITNKMIVE
jgi:hypothetical protein